jgi:Tol biopolymer transport system component
VAFPLDGGDPVCLTDASLAASFPAVSTRDGSIAYASRYLNTNIWRIDLTGKPAAQRMVASNLLESAPQYSPDGTKSPLDNRRSV